MIIFYYEEDEYFCFNTYKKTLSAKINDDSIIKISDIFIEKSKIKSDILDKTKITEIFFYNSFDILYLGKKYQNFVYNINNFIKNIRNIKIVYYIFNFLSDKNTKIKYYGFRLFYKIFSIGSFLFLKRTMLGLTDESYIIMVPAINTKSGIQDLVIKITSLIENNNKNNIYTLSFIIYTANNIKSSVDSYNTCEYKILNTYVLVPYSLSLSNKILSDSFANIMSNDQVKLYIKLLNKKQIDIFVNRIRAASDFKISNPIYYNIKSEYSLISRIMNKHFDLNSMVDFIKFVNSNIDEPPYKFHNKNEVFRTYFYILLGLSLFYSSNITKIDSIEFFINETRIKKINISFRDGIYNTELSDFNLLLISEINLREPLKNVFITIGVYKANLPFLDEYSSFIFPVVKVSKFIGENKNNINEKNDLIRTFESNLLDKKLINTITLKTDMAYTHKKNFLRDIKIEIEYKII